MCIFGRARASSLVETTEKKVSRGGVKKKKTKQPNPGWSLGMSSTF